MPCRWLGLGDVWWTMESCMDYTSWGRQGFYYELLGCKCKKTCKGNCKVSESKPAVHFTESLWACDGQCYGNCTCMYRGQLSWIQIRSYTYSLPEIVSHSYCFSNCLRFKTVDLRNYVLTVAILEFNMAGSGYSKQWSYLISLPWKLAVTRGSAFLSALISKLYATR